jgi:predicted O-methyltransferase YrrM
VETPPLVTRALALAEATGFEISCDPEVGALLHVLASSRGRLRVAEIGTGCGVGSAWIVSGLAPETPFFTAELDPGRAAAVRELFAGDENVHVLEGDWRETLPPEAPFDLLFVDGGKAKWNGEEVISLLAPGGVAVIDDLTPGLAGDPVREFWLGDPRLAAVEVLTRPESAAIVAARR